MQFVCNYEIQQIKRRRHAFKFMDGDVSMRMFHSKRLLGLLCIIDAYIYNYTYICERQIRAELLMGLRGSQVKSHCWAE